MIRQQIRATYEEWKNLKLVILHRGTRNMAFSVCGETQARQIRWIPCIVGRWASIMETSDWNLISQLSQLHLLQRTFMLPLPGAASSSWSLFKTRCTNLLEQVDVRIAVAFWLFGLVNNVLYVIILSSALDLVGPTVPKSAVLLFDVVPSFFVKLTAPYYIHVVPYRVRVFAFAALSTCGMLIIALTGSASSGTPRQPSLPSQDQILLRMSGVVIASISSGGGELSFLGLTSFYGSTSLAAWGSGTGGAGLVGAGAYVLATTTIGLSVRTTLLASSLLPVIMLVSFFMILPARGHVAKRNAYEPLPADEDLRRETHYGPHEDAALDEDQNAPSTTIHRADDSPWKRAWVGFRLNLRRARGLVVPL